MFVCVCVRTCMYVMQAHICMCMHIFNDAFCDYARESLGRLDLLMLTTVFLKLEFKNI